MTSTRQDNAGSNKAGQSTTGQERTRQDSGGGPVARRIQLGARLRRLRQAADVTREDAGWHIRGSGSKISRMELGRVPLKERDVADLLTLYGVGDQDRADLMQLAREANTPGWWQRYNDLLPPRLAAYLGLEDAASLIRAYEIHAVPALLQTDEYARVVIRHGHADAPDAEIDRRLRLRQSRQEILHRADPPLLWAVLDEAVLRRRFGGGDVMRGQVQALIAASRRPNIRLQIVPFTHTAPAAAGFPFTILRFSEFELSDVVYLEQLTGAQYLDKRTEVEHYAITMERSCMQAAPPERTVAILHEVLDAHR
jgi:hypothetical protein